MSNYFKCTNTVDRDEDPIFVKADSEAEARAAVYEAIGSMPPSMLIFEKIPALPEGEEALNA